MPEIRITDKLLTDPELIEAIAKFTGLDELVVTEMLRYNVVTIKQMQIITHINYLRLVQKLKGRLNAKGKFYVSLTEVHPFPESRGYRFILRDEKWEKAVRKAVRNLLH